MIRQVSEHIYRGPRLMPNEYKELAKIGVEMVINLEADHKAALEDDRHCKPFGIFCAWLPMSELLPCSAKRLSDLADKVEFARHPVYVHCRRGIDRTGQVIAAWRIRYGGYSFEQAYEEQVSFGHPELYNLLGWKWVLSQIKEAK